MRKSLSFLIILFIPFLGCSQNICESVNEDLKIIIDLVFEPELIKSDSIVLKYNFNTVCIEKIINKEKILLWSESKIYNELYENYYSLEHIEYSSEYAKIIYLQRSNNFIFKFLLNKQNGIWKIINEKYKWQAKLKSDDFLLNSIRNQNLKNKN